MDSPESDTLASGIEFQSLIPLPFKIILLVQLGIYLWWLLVVINYKYFDISVIQLLGFSYSPHNYAIVGDNLPCSNIAEQPVLVPADQKENTLLANGIWKQLRQSTIIFLVSFIVYHVFNLGRHKVYMFGSLANLVPFIGVSILVYNLVDVSGGPFNSANDANSINHTSDVNVINVSGKIRFASTLKRILVGGINYKQLRTNDILISDSLVSYNRVINDIMLYIWIIYYGIDVPYGLTVEFIACSLPVFIRIRQCWYEFKSTGNKQHLLNLIKYTTNLPPLIFHLLDRKANIDNVDAEVWTKWWYVFATINSTYSFIWDITMDWGLNWLKLRPANKLIGPASKYYILIVVDFSLRFIWLLKYFNYNSQSYLTYAAVMLFGGTTHQCGYALIETFEIIRRWIWCFVKLENDWFKLQPDDAELKES